jgi:excisionase family DNA binding protein
MQTTSDHKDLLSEKQAAERLGIARITLLRAREAGRIRFFRIGTRVLYSEEHISEFLLLCESNGRQSVDRKPAVIPDGLKPNGGTLEGKLEGNKKASGFETTRLLPFS